MRLQMCNRNGREYYVFKRWERRSNDPTPERAARAIENGVIYSASRLRLLETAGAILRAPVAQDVVLVAKNAPSLTGGRESGFWKLLTRRLRLKNASKRDMTDMPVLHDVAVWLRGRTEQDPATPTLFPGLQQESSPVSPGASVLTAVAADRAPAAVVSSPSHFAQVMVAVRVRSGRQAPACAEAPSAAVVSSAGAATVVGVKTEPQGEIQGDVISGSGSSPTDSPVAAGSESTPSSCVFAEGDSDECCSQFETDAGCGFASCSDQKDFVSVPPMWPLDFPFFEEVML
eukprot:m51a1_g4383 hypothetical protein (288) ;mRNA; f:338755-339752